MIPSFPRKSEVGVPAGSRENDPHRVEFWTAYRSSLGSEMPTGKTFNDLIEAYKLSPEFTRRSEATQRDYSRYLDILSSAWGNLLVTSLRPKHVIQLRDTWAKTPVAANHLVSVLKTLVNWGIPREFAENNPCIYVPKLEAEEGGARPWPAWAYKLIEQYAKEDVRRAVMLARYTGMSPAMITRYSRFADQKRLAKAAVRRLEGRTRVEREE
jgi:hypothetical protein